MLTGSDAGLLWQALRWNAVPREPLKFTQVKHGICHTHGNDMKLVSDGALVFLTSETLAPPSG